MPNFEVALGQGSVSVEFDEGLYPLDAVYGAAYVFIDRCYVHLDRAGDKRLRVSFKAKREGVDTEMLAGDFQNELLGQAWRRRIVDDGRAFIEAITARALGGAAGPPGLDELLATDIGELSAFEDPLGIAMSWEEKYLKKKEPAAGEAEATTAGEGAEPPKGSSEPKPG
jgi:His-Xaa-Ser system protein HxsD